MSEVRFEVLPPDVGVALVVVRAPRMDLIGSNRRVGLIETARIPIQSFTLATQTIHVAFDPEEGVLYVGERHGPGWMESEIARLDRAADRTRTVATRAEVLLKSRKPGKRRRGRKLVARIADGLR